MKTGKVLLLKALFLIFFLSWVNVNDTLIAQESVKGSITIKKSSDFKVTGDGSSANWKGTEWISLAEQGPDISGFKTQVKVLYSEKGIYFLFNCEDKKITATMKADFLDLFLEDVVEVFLWTDESFPVYFEYEVSPLNYELPIIIPNYKGTFYGWQPWHYEGERRTQHETSVTGGKKTSGSAINSWMAEFFIPYKLLVPLNNVPPKSGSEWRANMYRIDYDKGKAHFAWQKTGGSFHEFNKFGTFIFE